MNKYYRILDKILATGKTQTNKKGNTASHHNTDGIITAHFIGTEHMGEYLLSRIHTLYLFLGILHGVQILASFDLCLVIIGIKCRHNKGKDHNYNNNEEADHGNLILTKSAEAILPEAHALTHDDLALLLFFVRRHKIFRFIFYMKAHSIRFFHRYLPSC